MKVQLPQAVAKYFEADGGDANAIAACFAEDGAVVDENAEDKAGKTVVASRVTGDFPGSPVDLRYVFEVSGDSIASLEITG